MSKFILLLTLCPFVLVSCGSEIENAKRDKIVEIQENVLKPKKETEYLYSDSVIDELVANSLPTAKFLMDTLAIIQSANCYAVCNSPLFTINDSDVKKYDSELIDVSDELKEWLNITHCFCRYFDNSEYKINVYYNQQYESHYSASLELISINKDTYDVSKLVLARWYGNELEDEIITSEIDAHNGIVRKIHRNYRYIHGIGSVDSASVIIEKYEIDAIGEIIKITSI